MSLGVISLTQQSSSHVSSSSPPARVSGETIVDTNSSVLVHHYPNTQAYSSSASAEILSLQKLKDRYTQWGKCKCPKEFQENFRPYKTDYTENQCLICGNLSGRKYN